MICPRCNSTIADGSLICPVCGDWCAASAQKERVDNLKSKTRTIAHESFKSKLFQAMTILMTVTAAARTLTCFSFTAGGGSFGFSFDITVIFFIIAAVFCWQAARNDKPILAGDHLGRIAFLDSVQAVLLVIAAVLIGLAALLCFAMIGIGSTVIAEAWGEIEPEIQELLSGEELELVSDLLLNQAGLLFAVMAFILLIATAFCVWGSIIYFQRKRYLKDAEDSLTEYNIEKAPPYTSAIVFASISLFSTIVTFGTTVFTAGFSFASLVGTLALDCYIIVSTVWMTQLHKDELANNAEIENESALLNNLIYSSKIASEKKAAETNTEE